MKHRGIILKAVNPLIEGRSQMNDMNYIIGQLKYIKDLAAKNVYDGDTYRPEMDDISSLANSLANSLQAIHDNQLQDAGRITALISGMVGLT